MERFTVKTNALDHLKSFLDIPEFEVVTERSEVLKYLKAGLFEETPYRVFGKKSSLLPNDRVAICIQTPEESNGSEVAKFQLNMSKEEIKGLWRLIDKSRKKTGSEYKKDLKKYKKTG